MLCARFVGAERDLVRLGGESSRVVWERRLWFGEGMQGEVRALDGRVGRVGGVEGGVRGVGGGGGPGLDRWGTGSLSCCGIFVGLLYSFRGRR